MQSFVQQSHVSVFAGRPAVLWPYVKASPRTNRTLVVKVSDGIGAETVEQEALRIVNVATKDDLDALRVDPDETIVVSHVETYNDDHLNFCIALADRFKNQTYVLLCLPDHVEWRDDAFPRPEDVDPTWRQFATDCILLYRQTDYFADGDPTIIERPLRRYEL
jgi:hypothetical protein